MSPPIHTHRSPLQSRQPPAKILTFLSRLFHLQRSSPARDGPHPPLSLPRLLLLVLIAGAPKFLLLRPPLVRFPSPLRKWRLTRATRPPHFPFPAAAAAAVFPFQIPVEAEVLEARRARRRQQVITAARSAAFLELAAAGPHPVQAAGCRGDLEEWRGPFLRKCGVLLRGKGHWLKRGRKRQQRKIMEGLKMLSIHHLLHFTRSSMI